MSSQENKHLIRRYLSAIDDNATSDWSILDEYIAEDFVAHNPASPGVGLDREGMKQAAEIFRVATPGRHEITLQIAEGDLVVSHVLGRGVHAGELLGIPATHKEVETEGIAIHRVRDGKIVEYWSVSDIARVLQQIGVLPGLSRLSTRWTIVSSVDAGFVLFALASETAVECHVTDGATGFRRRLCRARPTASAARTRHADAAGRASASRSSS